MVETLCVVAVALLALLAASLLIPTDRRPVINPPPDNGNVQALESDLSAARELAAEAIIASWIGGEAAALTEAFRAACAIPTGPDDSPTSLQVRLAAQWPAENRSAVTGLPKLAAWRELPLLAARSGGWLVVHLAWSPDPAWRQNASEVECERAFRQASRRWATLLDRAGALATPERYSTVCLLPKPTGASDDWTECLYAIDGALRSDADEHATCVIKAVEIDSLEAVDSALERIGKANDAGVEGDAWYHRKQWVDWKTTLVPAQKPRSLTLLTEPDAIASEPGESPPIEPATETPDALPLAEQVAVSESDDDLPVKPQPSVTPVEGISTTAAPTDRRMGLRPEPNATATAVAAEAAGAATQEDIAALFAARRKRAAEPKTGEASAEIDASDLSDQPVQTDLSASIDPAERQIQEDVAAITATVEDGLIGQVTAPEDQPDDPKLAGVAVPEDNSPLAPEDIEKLFSAARDRRKKK